jgi:succinate-semialdehyde dehydrogenase/glutarate-semialdehyde dehydrogenase
MNDQASGRPSLCTNDPATGRPGRAYEGHTLSEAQAAAAAARSAFETWRGTSFAHRAELMRAAARVLRARAEEFAGLMTDEMGKTLTEGRAEIEKCAFNCDWFADNAELYLAASP